METLRRRGDDLRDELRAVAPAFGRELHEEWSEEFYVQGERPEDPIERAVRFYFLRYSSFAGKHRKTGFRTSTSRSHGRQFSESIEELEWFRDRLSTVTIENLDYRELIDRYDRESALFYLDPPYYEKDLYQEGQGFDHSELFGVLSDVEGYVVVSYEELPPAFEDLPDGWREEGFTAAYRNPIEGKETKEAEERLLMNFPADEPTMNGGVQSGLDRF